MDEFLKRDKLRRKAGCNANFSGVNDNYMLLDGAMSSSPSTTTPPVVGGNKYSKAVMTRGGKLNHRFGGNSLDSALNTAFEPLAELGRNGGAPRSRYGGGNPLDSALNTAFQPLAELGRNGGNSRSSRSRYGGNFMSDIINATSANNSQPAQFVQSVQSASAPPAPPANPAPPAPPATATGGCGNYKYRRNVRGGTIDLAPFLTSVALLTARAASDEELMKAFNLGRMIPTSLEDAKKSMSRSIPRSRSAKSTGAKSASKQRIRSSGDKKNKSTNWL